MTTYIQGDVKYGHEIIKYLEDKFHAANPHDYKGNCVGYYYFVCYGRIYHTCSKPDSKYANIVTYQQIKEKMNKASITIEIPDGKVAKQITNPDGSINITFVDKGPVRSKSWEEFCNNHPKVKNEYFLGLASEISITSSEKRSKTDASNLETKEDAEGILALIQLTRLHDEWVGDWKLPTDKESCFWMICNTTDKGIDIRNWWYSHTFLVFPTREMTEEFLKYFKDLIEKAKRFI